MIKVTYEYQCDGCGIEARPAEVYQSHGACPIPLPNMLVSLGHMHLCGRCTRIAREVVMAEAKEQGKHVG